MSQPASAEQARSIRRGVHLTRERLREAMVALENVQYGQLGYGNGATMADVYSALMLAQHAVAATRSLIILDEESHDCTT